MKGVIPIQKRPSLGQIAFTVFIMSVLFSLSQPLWAQKDFFWKGLVERLSRDGFKKEELLRLYHRKGVRFEPRVMPKKLLHKERALDYSKFLEEGRIRRAQCFLRENQELLSKTERYYGVPPEINVAILLVETDLGNHTGPYRTFTILSSMAVSDDIPRIKEWIPEGYLKDEETLKAFRKKASQTARWAYQELKAFLRYSRENSIDPLSIKGSPFGAFGLCQFMPSSVMRFGVDFDEDGAIDLFSLPDALASMANYLRMHGWRPGIGNDKAFKVLLAYNHSRPYAKTVLEVAERIKEASGSQPPLP